MRRSATIVSLALVLGVLGPAPPPASAHAMYATVVVRPPAGRPAPALNGSCDEYSATPGLARIGYAGLYPSATARFLADRTSLYVCISRLPRESSGPPTVVALEVDGRHDGGRTLRSDDWKFSITRSGVFRSYQGSPDGWVPTPIPFLGTVTSGDATWTAELRISLTDVGGGTPFSLSGVAVRQEVLDGNTYVWPPGGRDAIPDTWADLFWGVFPTATGPGVPVLDVERITQGLDEDVQAIRAYDYIAGKDTLARAQVYTGGRPAEVTYAACSIHGPSGSSVLLPAAGVPVSRVNLYPAGSFNGNPRFECWIPGSTVSVPGRYVIDLLLRIDGIAETQRIFLGDPVFVRTRDLRLYLSPFEAPAAPDYRTWGTDLTAAVPGAMLYVQRVIPVRSGAGPMVAAPVANPFRLPGLRYTIGSVRRCRIGETMSACGARVGTEITDAMRRLNEQLRLAESVLPPDQALDRVDYGFNAQASTGTGGGGDCGFGDDVIAPAGVGIAGGGFDVNLNGSSPSIIAHEITHCLGEVRTTSPHYISGGHSGSPAITLVRGDTMVNTVTRQDVSTVPPLMAPAVGDARSLFDEGYEWNDVRSSLVGMPRPAAIDAVAAGGDPLFTVAGYLDDTDTPTVVYSSLLAGGYPTTAPDQGGPLDLVFLDGKGDDLTSFPFSPTDVDVHGTFSRPNGSFLLTVALPDGAAGYEIRRGGDAQAGLDFTLGAPSVTDVEITPGDGAVTATWTGSDPDGDPLTYNVYYRPTSKSPTELVAAGLTDPAYSFPLETSPATTDAVLVVEASDGLNTGAAESSSFTVDPRSGGTAIAWPSHGARVVAGQPVALVGGGYDLTDGPLAGAALTWRSSLDGLLGHGARAAVRLSPGVHLITLKGVPSSGLSSTDTVKVIALPDKDADGVPDGYESAHECLSPARGDSWRDPDGDGLASFGERADGTDPCAADTDHDGSLDGDEARLGGDALDSKVLPDPPRIYLPDERVDLGACALSKGRRIRVTAAWPAVAWQVGTDVRWLKVEGEGPGNGSVTLTPSCSGLAKGMHLGHVLIWPPGGQFRAIEVVLRR